MEVPLSVPHLEESVKSARRTRNADESRRRRCDHRLSTCGSSHPPAPRAPPSSLDVLSIVTSSGDVVKYSHVVFHFFKASALSDIEDHSTTLRLRCQIGEPCVFTLETCRMRQPPSALASAYFPRANATDSPGSPCPCAGHSSQISQLDALAEPRSHCRSSVSQP